MVCGGGVHNDHLMSRLKNNLPDIAVSSTGEFGLDPDWVEAAAFAWLAMRTVLKQPGNLPSVTGATRGAVLGGIYFGTS
jgi:anhydro-N-acetylmuramic acid kinase